MSIDRTKTVATDLVSFRTVASESNLERIKYI